MQPISSEHAAQALDRLLGAASKQEAKLQRFSTEKKPEILNDDADSSSPIYDSFYFENKSETIMKMTNFSSREFDLLWNVVSEFAKHKWNTGRGRKYSFKNKDVFFMTLTTLKHEGKWDFLGHIFNLNGATFERLITKFISTLSIDCYNYYVDEVDGKWHMKRVLRQQLGFKNFKFCRYATDVIFQQSYRPTGNIAEGKNYYSGKHKLYGFKTEVSVLSNGLAINGSNHAPGATSDREIFYSNIETHKIALKKRDDEGCNFVIDSGLLLDEYGDFWGVLLDKGYQGAAEHVRAIHPKKKPQRGVLPVSGAEQNRKISSDRVIVENYFGRLTQLWSVIGFNYRWSEKIYDEIFMFCTAFTNAHVNWHPLRAGDGEHYNRVCNRLIAIGNDIGQKRQLA